MDIIIVAQYLRNIECLEGNNSRFIYLAKLLVKETSNHVEIVTSNFLHGEKRSANKVDQLADIKITAINEPGYPKNICLKRFYSHAMLALNIRKYLCNRKKPDCIYCAIPSLDVAKVVADYCKENNVKFIIDVQDLWPEAFRMVFNVPIISDLIFKPMDVVADYIYAQADEIVAVSDTYCERAMRVNSKCKKTHTVYLGTNLIDFDNNAKKQCNFVVDKDVLKLAYCGTLGRSYDLTCVIDALKILKNQGIEIPKFIVMGDGPQRNEFEEYAKKQEIDVVFTGRLEYPEMCSLLCRCDMVVNPIVGKSAATIINKHADYAACGLPVLNTQESEEYCFLIDKYTMGYNCVNGDADDLAKKTSYLIENKQLRETMGKAARRCAEERFDRGNSYNEILETFI